MMNIISSAAQRQKTKVAIVGGGISGLAAAYHLSKRLVSADRPLPYLVLEGSHRLGGKVGTDVQAGLLLENGPDSLVTQKPAGLELCRELGLGDELLAPPPHDPTISIMHNGRLIPLPEGLQMVVPTRVSPVLESELFSQHGKERLLGERYLPPYPESDTPQDESLQSFITRRFGSEAFERVVEPIVGGLFAGDASSLSAAMTAPRLLELERRFGSVTGGVLKMRSRDDATNDTDARPTEPSPTQSPPTPPTQSPPTQSPPTQWALQSGMGRLIERLAEELNQESLLLENTVEGVLLDAGSGQWKLETRGGDVEADALILALPGDVLGALLAGLDERAASLVRRLQYASCAAIHLAFERSCLTKPLQGFGFFVPATESCPVLACSYASEKFSGRAPEEQILFRVFVGGTRSPQLLEQNDRQLIERTAEALRHLLGLQGEPVFGRVRRHPRSMPQFTVGTLENIRSLEERLLLLPGLFVAGSPVGAYGIPDCISSGLKAAEQAVRYLACSIHEVP